MAVINVSDIYIVVAAVVLGVAYCCLHHYAGRQRRARLLSRSPSARDQLVRAFQGGGDVDTEVVVLVVEAVAKALGVPVDRIRPTDTFERDYSIWCRLLFLDDFGELLLADLNRRLGATGVPAWTCGRARIRSVGDLAQRVNDHVRWNRAGRPGETDEERDRD
jgi:hypothetical protein